MFKFKLKKDQIRFFMKIGELQGSTDGQAEHDQAARNTVMLSSQAEQTCSEKMHEWAEQQCIAESKNKKSEIDGSVQGDQAEQVCSKDMQTSREEKSDRAEQTSSGERDQPVYGQAEHLMCKSK